MRLCAIVPQQRLSLAKSRLGTILDPRARERLSLSLLRQVCAVLREVPSVEGIVILTPDPAVRHHAGQWGIPAWPDPAPDLNAALAGAAARGWDAGGCRAALVIAGDLPWVSPADVTSLAEAAGPDTLVLAPSKDGTGTNALVVPRGVPFRPAYGPGSRAAHRREAMRAGLRLIELYRPGLAFDVDVPEDLEALRAGGYSRG